MTILRKYLKKPKGLQYGLKIIVGVYILMQIMQVCKRLERGLCIIHVYLVLPRYECYQSNGHSLNFYSAIATVQLAWL